MVGSNGSDVRGQNGGRLNAVIQHKGTDNNKEDGPEARQFAKFDQMKRVEEEQHAKADQKNGADGGAGSEAILGDDAGPFVNRDAQLAFLGGVVSLKRHVEDISGHHNAKERFAGGVPGTIDKTDKQSKYDGMDETLHVLAVIDSADTGDPAQEKSQAGRCVHGSSSSRRLDIGIRTGIGRAAGLRSRGRAWRSRPAYNLAACNLEVHAPGKKRCHQRYVDRPNITLGHRHGNRLQLAYQGVDSNSFLLFSALIGSA